MPLATCLSEGDAFNEMLNYCLDRTHARQARFSIQSRYLSVSYAPARMSIFEGYGFSIPDDFQREREGLTFLSRQAEHFRSPSDYLFITQDVQPERKPYA